MDEEAEDYYDKTYKNEKERTGININKQLKIDYQRFCLELSRNSKKMITASSRLRLLMVKDMLEHQQKV